MPNTLVQREINRKLRLEKQDALLQLLASGSTIREALLQLAPPPLDTKFKPFPINFPEFLKWREDNPVFDAAIKKYLAKKFQDLFADKYCQFLKDEFSGGGCNRSFAEKYDLPLAKVLSWERFEPDFKTAHDEAVAENVPVICQQLLDHMASGLSIRTFPAALGELPGTVKLWYAQWPFLFETRKLARLGLIKGLEETGQRALQAEKFPAATYSFIMKNLADWRDITKKEAKDLPRPQVVVVLPEQRRQISEADIIDIKPREVRQLDFRDVG